jgi:hypothetical protein
MHFAIRAAGEKAAWRAVLWEIRAEIDGVLTGDFTGCRVDQNSGEGLRGGIKAEEHGRRLADSWTGCQKQLPEPGIKMTDATV